jgi:hypothetical protein
MDIFHQPYLFFKENQGSHKKIGDSGVKVRGRMPGLEIGYVVGV